ncbi:hypothetical protein OG216_08650 [Streptomycetaceae bacterium NBC_01309]
MTETATDTTEPFARLAAGAVWHDHAGFHVRIEDLPVENGRTMVEYRALHDPDVHHVFSEENFRHVFAPAAASGLSCEAAAIRAALADAVAATTRLAHPTAGVLVGLAHRAHRLSEALAVSPDGDEEAAGAAEQVADLLHRAGEALRAVADERIRPAVELIDAELTDEARDTTGTAHDDPAA